MEKTYEERVAAACEDLIGTVCDSISHNLEYHLGREVTKEDLEAAEQYMIDAGISECDCCGWIQNDNDGAEGNLCWRCADDADLDFEDEDEEI